MARQQNKDPLDPLKDVRVLKPSELQRLKGGARPGPEAEPLVSDDPPPVVPDDES